LQLESLERRQMMAGVPVTVMSENLYVGADVTAVVLAEAAFGKAGAIPYTTQFWQDVQNTNFDERADAIVKQIVANKPALVGLQEVWQFWTGAPDSLRGNPTQADNLQLDFLQTLEDKLAAKGLPYETVDVAEGCAQELPAFIQGKLQDIRVQGNLAIIARKDLLDSGAMKPSNIQDSTSVAQVSTSTPGDTPPYWHSVDVTYGGCTFRYINMCLATEVDMATQQAQARELVAGPAATSLPVILAGDSNTNGSPADGKLPLTYTELIGGGFQDAWVETNPNDPGYTWGNQPDLLNPEPMSYYILGLFGHYRMDLVLCRGGIQAQSMKRVGVLESEKTVSDMWPSDHAGVVATLVLPAAPAVFEVAGTDGADTIVVKPGSSAGAWSIGVNGQWREVAGGSVEIQIDAQAGVDTVDITTTAQDSVASLRPGGGQISGPGYSIAVNSGELITVHASGAQDQLSLDDSPGNDTLTSGPGSSTLSGNGFSLSGVGFERVSAYARNGGRDTAFLNGGAGTDKIKLQADVSWMYGAGYYSRAKFFDGVYADGRGGGGDAAVFYDTAGKDVLVADRAMTTVTTGTLIRRATSFENVTVYGTSIDTATLGDSAGDDIFDGLLNKSRIYNAAYQVVVRGYRNVTATASTGFDKARLYDTPWDDSYEARPGISRLTGGGTTGLRLTAQGFDKVSLVANQGGTDRADLYGTAYNDRLDAAANWARLYRNIGTPELLYETLAVERVTAHGSTGANTRNIMPPLAFDLVFEGAWQP